MGRLGLAIKCFFQVLSGKPVPDEALSAEQKRAELPAPAHDHRDHAKALQLLGLLQKEGRLLDFLQEDISEYTDEQIGTAVRKIHQDCRRALLEHIHIQTILEGAEDSAVTVPSGFDPATIRLIGNVTGNPPFSGVVRHRGWKATQVRLPELTGKSDSSVIAPAEVELR